MQNYLHALGLDYQLFLSRLLRTAINGFVSLDTCNSVFVLTYNDISSCRTFPAERNYLRRRADMHAVWTWLSMRYRAQKRQLKKLNHIYTHLQRTIPQARRRDQVTRCSSPESTPTLLTGPPTPVSCSETGGIEGEANGVGGDDLTAARVRPFIRENLVTANVQQSAAQVRSPTHSRCILSRYHELLDSVCGKPSVQCHCKYPEVSPCILCCGGAVDRELNPTNAAKSSRLQLPPPEKLYPRHKLDLSYHEKLSRPSGKLESLWRFRKIAA